MFFAAYSRLYLLILLSDQVGTELQFTIEAMLRAAADPIKDERLITDVSRSSYPVMPNSMACTSPHLLSSAAVVATIQLTRTRNPLLQASCTNTFESQDRLGFSDFVRISQLITS